MTLPRLRVTISAGIAEVELTRPEKLNAMDAAMFAALSETGTALAQEPGLRAVILHGSGAGFCAGIDTAMLMSFAGRIEDLRTDIMTPRAGEAANRFQHPCTVWADLPVPVIAALHGPVFGAGLQLALGADLRIAAPDARFSIMEMKWGLIPDMGLTRLLPPLMRADHALELILSARVVDAPEAVAIGLATSMAEDPLEQARALAQTIAAKSPEAARGAKALVRAAWPGDETHLALEARLQAAIVGSANQLEAVMAQMQKRPANFSEP